MKYVSYQGRGNNTENLNLITNKKPLNNSYVTIHFEKLWI